MEARTTHPDDMLRDAATTDQIDPETTTSTVMIRATVTPGSAAALEADAAAMFEAVEAAHPDGVRYASLRVPGTDTFIVLLSTEGEANPLTEVPEFRRFQERLQGRLAGAPVVERLAVVGSYRLL
jgi:hypothetical protein